MKKLPLKYENPFDNMIYILVEEVTPYLYKAKLTPNMITTGANILSIIGLINLWSHKYFEASIYFGVSYVLDCIDGYMARKYKMVSKFGDYYDHISDISKWIIFAIVLYLLKPKTFIKILPLMLLSLYLLNVHLSTQEYYYNNKESSPSLEYLKRIIPSCIQPKNKKQSQKNMRITRYFGSGTFNFVMVLIIMFYKKLN